MNTRSLLLAALLTAIIVGVVLWPRLFESPASVSYGDVSVQQASDLIKAKPGLVILDVRTPQEYGEGHLKGSILIPVEELASRLGELSKEKELLIYCRTGNRSRTAVNTLTAAGYRKMFHMNEGISAWLQQGYSVEK
jgi:rhodanese-related sulfurtransferase